MTTPERPDAPDAPRATESWTEVRAGVEAALALPAEARADFLERTYGDHASLLQRIKELLTACERAAGPAEFLVEPASTFAAPLLQNWQGEPGEQNSAADLHALRSAWADRYEIERELARGGTATVYLARDLRHGRRVAIKVLDPAVGAALSAHRFLHEIRVTAGLAHPHILPLHDSGEAAGRLYYVMPLIEGETLRERIARDGPLPIGDALRIFHDVADALAYAHGRGVVHRDIKPANILLAAGHALVADFGIARAVQRARELPDFQESASATSPDERHVTLTAEGTSPGTPAYMAPEQASGATGIDHRADLYALGVVMYEALAGAHPFGARSSVALLAAHREEPPAPLVVRRPDVPPALASLVLALLAKDPAARPQSAQAVLQALRSTPAEVKVPTSKRWKLRAFAAAALVVVVAASIGYALRLRTSAGEVIAPQSDAIRTLAVLPFENTGGEPGDEYFSDGMTDELAHALTRLPTLRIAGRTSSYAFKGKQMPAPQIGRALGVEALVSGQIRRAGDRLRLSTQLVSTADGTVVWDSVFESRTGDVFAVQDELVRSIVAALAPALRGQADTMALAERGTVDPAAYELYLKGNYHFLLRGADNVRRAVAFFQQAIARDPNFARAHAGLALAYRLLPIYDPLPSDSIFALMEASAKRAVALDSTLGAAQLALATALEVQLRFSAAHDAYRAAVGLDPASATAHLSFGFSLLTLGRHEEALPVLHRALQLDPAVKSAATAIPFGYLIARRFAEALDGARHAMMLDPYFPLAIFIQGQAQIFGGQPDSAVLTQERGVRLHPRDTRLLSNLLLAYAATGRWEDAQRIRARLHAAPDATLIDGTEAARADLVFGDREPLLRLLTSERGLRRYVMAGGVLGCNPLLDPLWPDARFRTAMQRLGIRPCALARTWPVRAVAADPTGP
ncbi:MAG TPA: protein kinase [Longimicrobiales bacterium]